MDASQLSAIADMGGGDATEQALLDSMLTTAERYVTSFPWCPPIAERFLGYGVGGVFAAFLFRFARPISDTDDWLWVFEGDVPSAYIVVDEAPTPATAISKYCELMEEWIHAVLEGSSLENVFPVSAPADAEYALLLESRIAFIRANLLPGA